MAQLTPSDDIHLAVIGAGRQGRDLINYALDLPGIRFQAIADIWPYSQKYAANLLKKRGHTVTAYENYLDLLTREKGLDAVIIATPDSFHAEQTIACLDAGLHVYCEADMATTIDGARQMVLAAQRKKKLLQIGRQHRSSPRYHLALDYIYKKKALGRITHVSAQWHVRQRGTLYKSPADDDIDPATLRRYGFASMDEHQNWRWFEKFSAGELAHLGSHQIDVFNWLLGTTPKAVTTVGGLDYYNQFQLYDNALCLLNWDVPWEGKTHTVRGTYDIQTTSTDGGFFEVIFGDEGSIGLSEDPTKGGVYRELNPVLPAWDKDLTLLDVASTGRLNPAGGTRAWQLFKYGPPTALKVALDSDSTDLQVHSAAFPNGWRLYGFPQKDVDTRPAHWHHLNNFFDAARGSAVPNCPGEAGFPTCVSVLKAVEAMKAGHRLELKPADFRV
jgi:predicted dehydrogenase